jgi:hypothetical protein
MLFNAASLYDRSSPVGPTVDLATCNTYGKQPDMDNLKIYSRYHAVLRKVQIKSYVGRLTPFVGCPGLLQATHSTTHF